MCNKKRILFVTESHKLASGFGTYAKEVISRLVKTNKYEIAELACYSNPESFENTDWLVYGVAPSEDEEEYGKQHQNMQVQWGLLRFEYACLDFRPDIVVSYRDPWMDAYIADSPYLPFFHWVWMPTIDSSPQKPEWLHLFNKCDGLLAYSEFGIKTLKEQTHGRIQPKDCAPPAIDTSLFNLISNKEIHKEKFGLPSDSLIIGTVMRNQKRKMFPELMKTFKTFITELEAKNPDQAAKTYLYLHTSYPEKHGWNITSLIQEYGLGSKILVTYVCKNCNKYFCSNYRDALTCCNHCNVHAAMMPGVSNGIEHKELYNIYNLMDLYVQYAICEGFGMPQVEAAACGVPIVSVNYSAMEDIVKVVDGYPIEPILERELETNADRSKGNNNELLKVFHSFLNQPKDRIKIQRLNTRKKCIEKYTWDNTTKVWENYLDHIEYKPTHGQWNIKALIKPLPEKYPKGLSHYQFAEWIFSNYIQNDSELFDYKMLNMIRDLNFGASVGMGKYEAYNQDKAFEESYNIAKRRHFFDQLRVRDINTGERFIAEAHRRIKK